jgi:hypothetical protein
VKLFGETAFVIKEFGVIEIGTFDVGRGSLGDGEKFLDAGLASAALQAFIAFPQSLSDGTSAYRQTAFGRHSVLKNGGLSEAGST